MSLSQFTYDDADKLTNIVHKDGAGTNTIDSFAYQFDAADRITQETSAQAPQRNYSYDKDGQITGDGTNTFAWDDNGNRINSGFTVTTGNRQSSDGAWNYYYDDEGNEIQQVNISTGETRNYSYDTDNRLVHMEKRTSGTSPPFESVDFRRNKKGTFMFFY